MIRRYRPDKTPWKKLASGLYVPPVLGFAGQPYPCSPPCVKSCLWCTGAHSEQVEIVIDGFAEGSCESCASLNGTYVAEVEHYAEGLCRWKHSLPSPLCGFYSICYVHPRRVDITNYPAVSPATMVLYAFVGEQEEQDCENFDKNGGFYWSVGDPTCDGTSATVTVVSL